MSAPAEDLKGRRNLGRGLAALFGDEAEATPAAAASEGARGGKTLPVEFLHPGRFQPRRAFNEAELQALAESIQDKGILQPILVRRDPDRADTYEIVAGERRWRAAQLAQLHEVPVVVRELADRDALEIALVENLQRQDLNGIEEAEAYKRLMDEFHHTQEELSRAVGKSRSHVANALRLLSLPEKIKALVIAGGLQPGHARALIGIPDAERIVREIVQRGLSVRETERMVQALREGEEGAAPSRRGRPPKSEAHKDADTLALERDLSNLLGLKVAITFSSAGGELRIHYKTLDQLDEVLHRLKRPAGPLDR